MAFAETRTGWNWPGLAATGAVQIALLLVAATAFDIGGHDQPAAADAIVSLRIMDPHPEPEPPAKEQVDKIQPPPGIIEPAAIGKPDAAPRLPVRASGAIAPEAFPAPRPATGPTVSIAQPPASLPETDEAPDPVAAYAAMVRQQIMAWKPGGIAASGEVRLTFTLDRAGRILTASIARSSGNVRLDRTALRMLRRAAPFDPPPEAIAAGQLTFNLNINFG